MVDVFYKEKCDEENERITRKYVMIKVGIGRKIQKENGITRINCDKDGRYKITKRNVYIRKERSVILVKERRCEAETVNIRTTGKEH